MIQDQRARKLVAEVVKRHFGVAPRTIKPLGGGLSNGVFSVKTGPRCVVVRLHPDPAKVHEYLKQQWAMEQARNAGIPAPDVLEVGSASGGQPFMITESADGIPASQYPDRLSVLTELGAYVSRLHAIKTDGYGPVFDWSQNRLSKYRRWSHYLDKELNATHRLGRLARRVPLSADVVEALRQDLDLMHTWHKPPVLQHGDLRLKNVMVDPRDGRIAALLDWDDCLSAPPPFWDLAIALHDLGIDEKEAFLRGYGVSAARFMRIARFLRTLNAINYAWALDRALAERRMDDAAWLRARIKGAFDISPPSSTAGSDSGRRPAHGREHAASESNRHA